MTPQKMSRDEVIEECAEACMEYARRQIGGPGTTGYRIAEVLAGNIRALASQAAAPAEPKRDYCPEKLKPGGCQLPNVHCGYPECNKPPAAAPAEPTRELRDLFVQARDRYAEARAKKAAAAAAPAEGREDDLVARLRLEAQGHAQEARTANATIADIYRLCTGGTGEPGNWHGAEPVRKALAERDAEITRLRALAARGEPVAVPREQALAEFTAYVAKNYPPDTIIGDPHWHAPRIFRAAEHALRNAAPQAAADVERMREALRRIAEHYTDTDLAAKHMRAIARAALSPTRDSADYAAPQAVPAATTAPIGAQPEQGNDNGSTSDDRGQQGVRGVRVERAGQATGSAEDREAGRVHDSADPRREVGGGEGNGRVPVAPAAAPARRRPDLLTQAEVMVNHLRKDTLISCTHHLLCDLADLRDRARTAPQAVPAADERDAARYRWLRCMDHFATADAMLDTMDFHALDHAVDTAMAREALVADVKSQMREKASSDRRAHEWDDDACCIHCGFDGAEWWHWRHNTYEGKAMQTPEPECEADRDPVAAAATHHRSGVATSGDPAIGSNADAGNAPALEPNE